MASSLMRLTRSVRPAIYASRMLNTQSVRLLEQRSPFCGFDHRYYATTPKVRASFDQAWLKSQMALLGARSILYTRVEGKHMVMQIPGMEKTTTDAGLCVTLNMPGVLKEDVNARVDGEYLLIQARSVDEEIYLAGMKLPMNFNMSGDLNGKLKDGILKLTLPKVDSWIANFFTIDYNQFFQLLMSFLVGYMNRDASKRLGSLEAWSSRSNALYMKITSDGRLYMKRSFELVKVQPTYEGLCVSLNMPGIKIEKVKSYFENNKLVIKGSQGDECYRGHIHIPEGYMKNNNMIKTEMNDGMYKATIPRVTKEMEEEIEKKKANGEFYIN